MRNPFIVIEGLDGCGKSSQAKILAERLGALHAAQPTHDGPHGKRIRSWLAGEGEMSVDEQIDAYADDRRWHLDNVISPELARRPVVCERYIGSSLAYQGITPETWGRVLERNSGLRTPDLTIWLITSHEVSMARISDSRSPDVLEAMGVEEHQARMARALRVIAQTSNCGLSLVSIVDGEDSIDNVSRIIEELARRLFSAMGAPFPRPRR